MVTFWASGVEGALKTGLEIRTIDSRFGAPPPKQWRTGSWEINPYPANVDNMVSSYQC